MAITRKSLITEKYSDFYEFLKANNFNEELSMFPDLDDIDVADLTYLLTFTFLGISDEEAFNIKIKELGQLNGIKLTEDKLNLITPLFFEFMIWLRAL